MKSKNLILYFLTSLFLIALFTNMTIFEHFQNYTTETPLTNHNVDLPLNTYYGCENMCGPNSQCSITRQQCTSDIDCYGCQPISGPPSDNPTKDVMGDNDAGRLIYNQNPRYSVLTTDIGTQATLYNKKNVPVPVPKPYLGLNTWVQSANYGLENQRAKFAYQYSRNPEKYKFTPHYPTIESATGLYMDNGPLPSNADL
jgi:hypothetical protein